MTEIAYKWDTSKLEEMKRDVSKLGDASLEDKTEALEMLEGMILITEDNKPLEIY